jgi:hypothetical protein
MELVNPAIEGSSGTVYVVMRGALKNESLAARERVGKIDTIWSTWDNAKGQIDWNIDVEISRYGAQQNGYWIDYRGVLTARNDYIA